MAQRWMMIDGTLTLCEMTVEKGKRVYKPIKATAPKKTKEPKE